MTAAPASLSATERARAAWGDDPPDWVVALAEACDAHGASQAKVAARLGYSKTALSLALRNSYRGGTDALAAKVMAVMGAASTAPVHDCPVLGALPVNDCLTHQRVEFDGANHVRVSLYRACRGGCPHAQVEGTL